MNDYRVLYLIQNLARLKDPAFRIYLLTHAFGNRGFNNFCGKIGTTISNNESNIETKSNRTRYCETKPENFIERFCSKLNINKEFELYTNELATFKEACLNNVKSIMVGHILIPSIDDKNPATFSKKITNN